VPGSPVTFRREKKSCATGPRTPCVTCAAQPGSEVTCDPRKRRNEGRPVTVTRRLARTFRHLRRPPLAPGYIGPVHASLAPNCRQHPRGRRATRPRASCGISRVALHCLPLMLSLSPSPPLGPVSCASARFGGRRCPHGGAIKPGQIETRFQWTQIYFPVLSD
jgi:hypothetical protein